MHPENKWHTEKDSLSFFIVCIIVFLGPESTGVDCSDPFYDLSVVLGPCAFGKELFFSK